MGLTFNQILDGCLAARGCLQGDQSSYVANWEVLAKPMDLRVPTGYLVEDSGAGGGGNGSVASPGGGTTHLHLRMDQHQNCRA